MSAAGGNLVEGEDYYFEGALVVFTEAFLRRRGYCCQSGCRHCPYGFKQEAREDATTTHEPEGD
ncbi:MAG TPA: DUF5522 domain-containing protein [Pyrinomonadaceae bacterium]|jgi:hypothetical protein|nr:DUF5522 domain-containing protein [Pyrinomonadaceae bacterium]